MSQPYMKWKSEDLLELIVKHQYARVYKNGSAMKLETVRHTYTLSYHPAKWSILYDLIALLAVLKRKYCVTKREF